MLRSCYLFDPQGDDRLLSAGRAPRVVRNALGAVLVVPRSLCVYLRLEARGVPWLRLRSYARLQLLARSPIVDPDVFVARQGDVLHLWLWDRDAVRAFAERHQLPRSRIQVVPSSVFGKPVPAAEATLVATPGSIGLHAQLWSSGQLLHDGWFEEEPDPLAWRIWRDGVARQEGVQWPQVPPEARRSGTLGRPWSRNLLHQREIELSSSSSARLACIALGAATLAGVAYGAWLQAGFAFYRSQIRQVESAQEELSGRLRPMEQAREAALRTRQWLVEAEQLVPRPTTTALLRRIGDIVTAQGAVIRDLDVQGDVVRATLAPAVDDLSLGDLTAALTQAPEFDDVRFVDAAPSKGLRFAWRLRGREARSSSMPPPGAGRS